MSCTDIERTQLIRLIEERIDNLIDGYEAIRDYIYDGATIDDLCDLAEKLQVEVSTPRRSPRVRRRR